MLSRLAFCFRSPRCRGDEVRAVPDIETKTETKTRFVKSGTLYGTARLWLAAAALAAAIGGTALGAGDQAPSAPPSPAASPSIPPQPRPADKPGFLHELGRWWNGSVGYLGDWMKGAGGTVADISKKSGDVAKDAAKGAAEVTQEGVKKTFDASKDAATAIVRLPNTRVVELHATCQTAPNGAPDCAKAATEACRGKGFNGGKPLDVRTAEKCDTTKAWQTGQSPGNGECPIESWITRAVCQ
jgi:hypothetical protein